MKQKGALPFIMPLAAVYFWNKAPFARLLLALIAGIVLQWQLQFSITALLLSFGAGFLLLVIYSLVSLKSKFRFGYINGIATNIIILLIGAILVWLHDVRHNKNWIGNDNFHNNYIIATIEEPLVEKINSFKASASVEGIYSENGLRKKEGQIILYFRKDSSVQQLHYGSQIIFKKPLQEIKNAGNPGSFDYRQYSLFQGITHQINLSANDFEILSTEKKNSFRQFIFNSRSRVVKTLQQFIKGEKEQGLAEALLIGYKDDLDKNLVQSYTNTGVVHIIAISGMHLALIYALLLILTGGLKRKKQLKWVRVVLILSALWLFTLLAGAQASVVRSAVMFTCIVFGEALSRKSSIYNTLALSAFLLLTCNPFWLWDVGFQLSYAAVLSIVIFYKPVYNWFYIPNKSIDFVWKTMAISIAAQILTAPVSLYHFHQFPVLFLFTNIVAVPLSGMILFGEIFICAFSWLAPVAKFLGWVTERFIYWMNSYIERTEKISFSLWDGFYITVFQTILLSIGIVIICFWLMEKKKWMLWPVLASFLLFISLRSWSFAEVYRQKKLIVYNVPKFSAIDLIHGRTFTFLGDSALLYDDFTRNFHVQPSRVLHRIEQSQTLAIDCKDFEFCNKKIAILDSTKYFAALQTKPFIDVMILSKNPKIYISNLVKTFDVHQIVIDGSVPQWKAKLWKKDCDSLHIPCYDVAKKGAFVMNL